MTSGDACVAPTSRTMVRVRPIVSASGLRERGGAERRRETPRTAERATQAAVVRDRRRALTAWGLGGVGGVGTLGMCGVLTMAPECPGEEHRSAGHGGIGCVESPEPPAGGANVHKVDNTPRGADAIDQITQCAAGDRGNGESLDDVVSWSRTIEHRECEQGNEGEGCKPPAGRAAKAHAERGARIVGEGETNEVADDVVRDIRRGVAMRAASCLVAKSVMTTPNTMAKNSAALRVTARN